MIWHTYVTIKDGKTVVGAWGIDEEGELIIKTIIVEDNNERTKMP